jgi:hypothetical protein
VVFHGVVVDLVEVPSYGVGGDAVVDCIRDAVHDYLMKLRPQMNWSASTALQPAREEVERE